MNEREAVLPAHLVDEPDHLQTDVHVDRQVQGFAGAPASPSKTEKPTATWS